MNVNEVYELIKFIINKNQQGYLSPADFNRTINAAQKQYTSFLLGTFQKYAPGRAVAPVEFGQNQVIRQRLSAIIYGKNLSVDADGFSPYPNDYLQTDAMWSIYGYQRIRSVQQDSLYSYVNSVIDPVASNPVYVIENVGFRFFPNSLGQAKLNYVRQPPDISWQYTNSIYGRPIYDAGTSIDPVWDDIAIFEVIARSLRMVGVNLQARDVEQFAEEIKTTGQ